MNCKHIRERLLEAGADQPDAAVEAHLKICPECREFRRRWEQDLLGPLRETPPAPPEDVWLNIKETIMNTELQRSSSRADLWSGWLSFLRPAYAATVTLVLLVGIFALYLPYRNMQLVDNYLTSQADFMAELSGTHNGNGTTSVDFGTSIEEFLL